MVGDRERHSPCASGQQSGSMRSTAVAEGWHVGGPCEIQHLGALLGCEVREGVEGPVK